MSFFKLFCIIKMIHCTATNFTLPRLFRNPAISNFFHFPWDFEIAVFNCTYILFSGGRGLGHALWCSSNHPVSLYLHEYPARTFSIEDYDSVSSHFQSPRCGVSKKTYYYLLFHGCGNSNEDCLEYFLVI